MKTKSTLRRVILPLGLIIALFAVSAPGAQALTEHKYGGIALNPGENLWSGAGQTNITGNIAVYTGAGSVSVCQRTNDTTSGVWREGCAIGAVGNALNLTPYLGHMLWPHIKNNSPWVHTIEGWWYNN